MNIELGLKRVSLAFWGFVGIWGPVMMIGALFSSASDRAELFWIGAALSAGCYAAYRVTNWIVSGFFAPR